MTASLVSSRLLRRGALAMALCTSLACAAAGQSDHPSIKRATSPPPSADLTYSIKVRQHGLALSGEGVLNWRYSDKQYSITSQTKVPLFGVILDSKSAGGVDEYGLAPDEGSEKRFRKDPTTVNFKRDSKTISFSEGTDTYPIKGGEQDRTSITWQLLSIARGAPDKFKPGSEWSFFVAGRHDADPWTFKVVNTETVHTGQGDVSAVHLSKTPPPEGHKSEQQIDVWLAPSLEWYPVRIRFVDNDGEDYVEQTLEKVSAK